MQRRLFFFADGVGRGAIVLLPVLESAFNHPCEHIMDEKVYLIKAARNERDGSLCRRLKDLIAAEGLLDCIADHDVTAVKTHFGESKKLGYVRPLYLKMLGEGIGDRGGLPFLTETSTLYKVQLDYAAELGFGSREYTLVRV